MSIPPSENPVSLSDLEHKLRLLSHIVVGHEQRIQDLESKTIDTGALKEDLKNEIEEGALIVRHFAKTGDLHSMSTARDASSREAAPTIFPNPPATEKPAVVFNLPFTKKPTVVFNPPATEKPALVLNPPATPKKTVSSSQPITPKQTSLHQSIHAGQAAKAIDQKPISPIDALADFKKRAEKSSIKLKLPVQGERAAEQQQDENDSSGPSSLVTPSIKVKQVDNIGGSGLNPQVNGHRHVALDGSRAASGLFTTTNQVTDIVNSTSPRLDQTQSSRSNTNNKPSSDHNVVDTSDIEAHMNNRKSFLHSRSTLRKREPSNEQIKDETVSKRNHNALNEIKQGVEKIRKKYESRAPSPVRIVENLSGPSRIGIPALGSVTNPFANAIPMKRYPASDGNKLIPQIPKTVWVKHFAIKLHAEGKTFSVGHLTEPAFEHAEILLKLNINPVGLGTLSLVGRIQNDTDAASSPPNQASEYSISFILPTCLEPESIDLGTVSDAMLLPPVISDMLSQKGFDPYEVPANLRYVSFRYKDFVLKGFQENETAEKQKRAEKGKLHEDSEKLLYFMDHLIASGQGSIQIWFLVDQEEVDEMFAIMRKLYYKDPRWKNKTAALEREPRWRGGYGD